MKFDKHNPYNTINYTLFGSKVSAGPLYIPSGDDYLIEIGEYHQTYESQAFWNNQCKKADWSKLVDSNTANNFYDLLINYLNHPKYKKGTTLLKSITSNKFEKGAFNHIVYSYKPTGYNWRKRTYIKFTPTKDISPNNKFLASNKPYNYLPAIRNSVRALRHKLGGMFN